MKPPLLSVALLLLLAGCAAGTAGGYGQGGRDGSGRSYAEARRDNLVAAEVTERLVRERSVPAMDITVTCRDGVVRLEGRVANSAIAARAAAIAASVSGVVRVENRLRAAR